MILVIVDQLITMVYYELDNITIDVSGLAKVILIGIIYYHDLSNLIINDKVSISTYTFFIMIIINSILVAVYGKEKR